MRHLPLLAAFATSIALAQTVPGGPDDPDAPESPALRAELPPLIEPDLRTEGADALRRTDFVRESGRSPANGQHRHPVPGAKEGK